MNVRLEAISKDAAHNLAHLIRENEEEILKAWVEIAKESQLQEDKPKLKLGYAIVLDLDKNKSLHKLSWTITHSREVESEIPDPNQPKLPIGGEK